MDFKTVARISNTLSKPFAEDILKLLLKYNSISASEAATRLDLHIKTAQDFLEELLAFYVVDKTEVFEKKRPYFRYTLIKKKLTIEVDFSKIYTPHSTEETIKLNQKIKEKINAGATFTTSPDNTYISSVSFFIGEGRNRKIRKISLTIIQGKFLYHLPFPTADFMSIHNILKKAEVDESHKSEILDIIDVLNDNKVIEIER